MFPDRLDGDRLALRLLAPQDAAALFAFLSLPEVIEPTSSGGWTLESLDEFLRNNLSGAAEGKWCRYGILPDGSNEPIGSVGLFNIDLHNQRAEIGYDLSPEHWGRGLMVQAASVLLGWAFTNGFHRIEATVMEGNLRSERTLEKLGFAREAPTLRDYKLVRGTFRNYSLWSLLP